MNSDAIQAYVGDESVLYPYHAAKNAKAYHTSKYCIVFGHLRKILNDRY